MQRPNVWRKIRLPMLGFHSSRIPFGRKLPSRDEDRPVRSIILTIVACLTVVSAANADPFPHRKPGLWQTTLILSGTKMPPMVSKFCIDAATESALTNFGQDAMKDMCSKRDVHVVGGNGTIDTVCKIGGSLQTTHTVVSFVANTAYHSEIHSHMVPPLYGKSDSLTISDARWTGPCPPGMKPGDMVMANGMKMHMGSPRP
jgi:hypothetical protein